MHLLGSFDSNGFPQKMFDFGILTSKIIFQQSNFCLILEGSRKGTTSLSDALQTGCVPVIVSDDWVLPFSEVIDWKRASIQLYKRQLNEVFDIISNISTSRILKMRAQCRFLWGKHFKDMSSITLTTLEIIEQRLFAHRTKTYEQWNDETPSHKAPLFLNRVAPNDGFTAVILAYERVASLFEAITRLGNVRSLHKVVVVWNNVNKAPPSSSEWPSIGKPVHVIRTKANKLTNRFVAYPAIETEAVFSLDDDITMLNDDEIEFGYQVWRENPSHLVGFPSRVHVYNSSSQSFMYNSEWTNNISMILTGAAFYHKYYGHLFTNQLPRGIIDFVNSRMNCEDIAMNFLIANLTGQPAIKVTPRKRFKCSNCAYGISTDTTHLIERSECIETFAQYFNSIPLKSVEFRADPVQYKHTAVPELLMEFPKIGPL